MTDDLALDGAVEQFDPKTGQDTRTKLKQVMAALFRCDVEELTDQTGPGDIPGWDSLGHVTLMAEIQKQFGAHVPIEDAIEVESIDDLVMVLERLQAG
jgi:acyl carrier protein